MDPKFWYHRRILEILDLDFCFSSGILGILDPKFLLVREILEIVDPECDFAVGSCRSWILAFHFDIGSCGSWILIFDRGTCLTIWHTYVYQLKRNLGSEEADAYIRCGHDKRIMSLMIGILGRVDIRRSISARDVAKGGGHGGHAPPPPERENKTKFCKKIRK